MLRSETGIFGDLLVLLPAINKDSRTTTPLGVRFLSFEVCRLQVHPSLN